MSPLDAESDIFICAQLFLAPFQELNNEDQFQDLSENGLLPLAQTSENFTRTSWAKDLDISCRNITFKNLKLASEMTRLLSYFEQKNVLVVPWKGPSLTMELYKDLSMRPFSDLDFLVADHQVNEALTVLLSEGYRAQIPHAQHSRLLPFDQRCTIELFHPTLNIHLDLTFKLIPLSGSKQQVRDMIKRAYTSALHGQKILRLTPEDLFLSLSAHGSKHGWSRRSWLVDLYLILLEYPHLDWTFSMSQAKRFGQSKHLASGILALSQILPREHLFPQPYVSWAKEQLEHVILEHDLSPQEEIKLLFKLHDHRHFFKTLTYLCCPSIQDWHQTRAQHFFSFKLWRYRMIRSLGTFNKVFKRS